MGTFNRLRVFKLFSFFSASSIFFVLVDLKAIFGDFCLLTQTCVEFVTEESPKKWV